jgi:hypothetical protein
VLKTSKGRECLEIFAPPPYRRGHDHNYFRVRFPALVPCSQPRVTGARARRPATSRDRPTAATPWPASALVRGLHAIRAAVFFGQPYRPITSRRPSMRRCPLSIRGGPQDDRQNRRSRHEQASICSEHFIFFLVHRGDRRRRSTHAAEKPVVVEDHTGGLVTVTH